MEANLVTVVTKGDHEIEVRSKENKEITNQPFGFLCLSFTNHFKLKKNVDWKISLKYMI